MEIRETADVLARIALGDNRNVDQAAVMYWHGLIGDLDYRDSVEAVRQYRMNSADYLQASHVREGVKRIRERRIDAHLKEIPPYGDPDDVLATKAHELMWRKRLADGYVPPAPAAITGGSTPQVDHLTQGPPRTDRPKSMPGGKSPLDVTCPWCHAEPGRPCTVNGKARHWHHADRQEAAKDTSGAHKRHGEALEAERQRQLRALEAIATVTQPQQDAGDEPR